LDPDAEVDGTALVSFREGFEPDADAGVALGVDAVTAGLGVGGPLTALAGPLTDFTGPFTGFAGAGVDADTLRVGALAGTVLGFTGEFAALTLIG
jgi:hypothetical protein